MSYECRGTLMVGNYYDALIDLMLKDSQLTLDTFDLVDYVEKINGLYLIAPYVNSNDEDKFIGIEINGINLDEDSWLQFSKDIELAYRNLRKYFGPTIELVLVPVVDAW